MGAKRLAKKSSMVELILPWPPSINRYWRRRGSQYFISKEGQDFRKNVILLCKEIPKIFDKNDKLFINIKASPPDKRRRDIDNILKALMDSLQHAEVYHDDNQINKIHIERQSTFLSNVTINLSKII